MARQLTEEQRLRRDCAIAGLYPFMQVYLKHHMKQPSGKLHEELCALLDKALLPGGRLVGAMPREHAKTTIGTTALVVRAAALGVKHNIIIIGANEKEAQDKLMNIKMELEENKLLRQDFGDGIAPRKRPSGMPWKDSIREVALANGTHIAAYPFMSRLRGRNIGGHRPDLVVLDDPEDDKSVESATERRKQMNWINSALINSLDKDMGSFVWLGTILHHDAALLNMIKRAQSKESKGRWDYIVRPAIIDDEPAWPERWSMADLMQRKQDIGSVAFEKEYMNNPVDPSTQVFKPEWWRFYNRSRIIEDGGRVYLRGNDPSIPGFPLAVFTAVDPAAGTGRIHDSTAIITVGVDPRDRMHYILDIKNEKISGRAVIDKLKSIRDRWNPRRIGYETVAAQGNMADLLRDEGINVTGIKPTGSKKVRITNAAAPVEAGQILLPEGEPMTEQFKEQAEQFPSGQHDDMLDAFAQVLEIVHIGTSVGVGVVGRKQNLYALTKGF